jgi:hypothetical protein
MQISIRLPGLRLEAVEAVSNANGIMQTYSNNSELLTKDKLSTISSDYDGNALKYLQMYSVLIKHVADMRIDDLMPDLIINFHKVLDDVTSDTYQEAVSIINTNIRSIESVVPGGGKSFQTICMDKLEDAKPNYGNPPVASNPDAMGDFITSISESDVQHCAILSAVLEMCQELISQEAILNESFATTVRNVKDKVTNTIVKFTVRDKEMSDQLNEKFNRYLGEYKENKKINAYDKIVKDSFNLSKLLKNLIGSSIIALLIPGGIQVKVIAAVTMLLIKFCLDKRTDEKHKAIILADLKFEKTMLDEKIRDAESKGDKKSKYQLMRTQNQVDRAIDRIRYSLAQN